MMYKIGSFLVVAFLGFMILSYQGVVSNNLTSRDLEKYHLIDVDPLDLSSRFIEVDDKKVKELAGIQLPETWWSRPYEYAWAIEFAGKDFIVLDAACGVSHPFKWALGMKCKEVWGCDKDNRIMNLSSIVEETKNDLGDEAHQTITNHPELYENVKLSCGSICSLPNYMPKFDRIFCISVLEHFKETERMKTLEEFKKFLKPDGLIVLTVDYPEITPTELIKNAREVGLEPVYLYETNDPFENSITLPADGMTTHQQLYVYRLLLKHAKNEN